MQLKERGVYAASKFLIPKLPQVIFKRAWRGGVSPNSTGISSIATRNPKGWQRVAGGRQAFEATSGSSVQFDFAP